MTDSETKPKNPKYLTELPKLDDPQRDNKLLEQVTSNLQCALHDYNGYNWDVAGLASKEIAKNWTVEKIEQVLNGGINDEEKAVLIDIAEDFKEKKSRELEPPSI